MKKVITFGVFDLLHYGHILLFEKCKAFGDYLIVAVQSDEFVTKNKPECKLTHSSSVRKHLVSLVSCVNEVIDYNQIDETIKKVDFDILAVGPDQINIHFQRAIEFCKENGKEVVVVSRTKNISSSQLRSNKRTKNL